MKIIEIDHIHVYVDDIEQAERWYHEVLGFSRDNSLYFWYEQGGPLVIKNNGASLSLFLREGQHPGHTMAFGVAAATLLRLIPTLTEKKVPFTICDHDVSMSVYFSDLSNNKIEITSYEYHQAKLILETTAGTFL